MGAQFIILARGEAGKVRGQTGPNSALDPIALEDGETFVLPLAVLGDLAHARALERFKADKTLPVDLRASSKEEVAGADASAEVREATPYRFVAELAAIRSR